MTDARLLSVAPSPAFWIAVAAYAVATVLLFTVLAGGTRFRSLALALVAVASLAHGIDIGWRGTQGVHPAESVREALGFLAFIITGGYLLASTRYRLTLGGVVVMPIALVLLLLARLTPAGAAPEDLVDARPHPHLARDDRRRGVRRRAPCCRRSTSSRIARSSASGSTRSRSNRAARRSSRSIGSRTGSCGSAFRSSRSR